MFTTIVHQTLEDRDNADHVEEQGPFAVDDIKHSYLGSGYYFWDDHIELAEWWGECRINGNYIICEGDLKVPKEQFFDLVGCRKDQIYFLEVIKKLNLGKLKIGAIIELLKDLERRPNKKGIFPFKVIRAVDIYTRSKYNQEIMKFAEKRNGLANLSPMMIICLIKKNKVLLPTYRIIYPDKYVPD